MLPTCLRSWLVVALAAGLGGLLGCGTAPAPVATKIGGTVYFQNRPVVGGLIVFSPDPDRGTTGPTLKATINEAGEYLIQPDMATFKASGWYRVAIADAPGTFTPELGYPSFPKALRRPDRSQLQREIILGQDNIFHFHVEVNE